MSVITSPSFVLSGVDDYATINNPIIGYDNIVELTNVLASSEDVDFPATNVANPATDLIWKAASIATVTFDVTNTNVDDIDYVGVVGHNFSSGGIAVKVQVDTGSGYVDYTTAQIPADDGPIIFRLPVIMNAASVRLHMASGSAIPQFAVMYVGRSVIVQRRLYVGHRPINMARSVAVVNGISQTGNYLGAVIVGEVRENSIDLSNMSPGWYRLVLDPFIAVCKSTPFFFAWRPGDYSDEVGFCWVINDPQPENQRANGMMSISIDLRGIA
jgi:hypothetical protein